MWADGLKDGQSSQTDSGYGGKQTFGVHPFALVETQTKGKWMGIFFRNTNAMSPVIRTNDKGQTILSYITTGG